MKKLLVLLVYSLSMSAFGWNGYDYENSTYVEIEKGNLVRRGREIELYDYQRGYINVEVESIRRVGSKVEVEVTDLETGELRTLEMDGR